MGSSEVSLIRKLPKAELHIHLEGSVTPETIYHFAQKYDVKLPYKSPDEIRDAIQMKPGENLLDFLKKVSVARFLFAHAESIRSIAYQTVEEAARSQVRYMEIQVNPDKPGGLSPSRILKEVARGAREAGRKYGVKVYVIAQINRSYSLDHAWKVARAAVGNFKHRDGVIALGLASDEINYPATRFRDVLQWAKSQGLKIVVHAGEGRGPESIRQALECGADAIDHGTRLLEDPALERELAQRRMSLRLCPTSQVKLGVVPNLKSFPTKHYVTRQIPVTLSRDDPEFFGGISLNYEYLKAYKKSHLTYEEIKQVTLNGFLYSFAPPRVKKALIRQFHREVETLEALRAS